MWHQLAQVTGNMGQRIITRDDPYFQQRLDSLKKTAISLSQYRIDHPNKLSALRCCPDIFVQYIVTVDKMGEKLFKIKWKWLDQLISIGLKYHALGNLIKWKNWFFQNMSVGSTVLVNSFIKLLLVVAKRRYMVWMKFPQYFLNFGQIDYHVFFNCINQCLGKPNQYCIMTVINEFTSGIEQNIRKFNRSFQGKETDSEVIAVADMFITIIIRIKPQNALDNQLYKYLFYNLIIKDDFSHQFLNFIRKYNKESLFQKWVEMLIQRKAFSEAVKFVEYTLFYCSASATNLRINQLIQHHQQWSRYWVTQLFKTNFIQTSKTFLNGEPNSFIIFNLLLQCYKYQNEKQFFQIMMIIDYQDHVKKLKNYQVVRQSVTSLFRKLSEDCDDVLMQLLEDQ